MTTFQKQLQKQAQKIRMRVAERRLLREQILSYMEYHPMSLVDGKIAGKKKTKKTADSALYTTEKFTYIRFNKRWFSRPVVMALTVLFIVGIPLAAEWSVPGDVLYPVKVRITEEVLSQLSLTPYKKVEFETWRVERRIAEARLLAKEGRLTDEAEASITETIKEHTASAQKELKVLRADDADEAAVALIIFESALDVQTAVLETDSASSGGDEEGLVELAAAIREAKANIVADGETASSSVPLYEKFSARVEEATTRARGLFASINGSVTEDERNDVERRLEDIDRLIIAALNMQEIGDNETAIQNLKNALGDTQKVIRFMTDIDVRLSVKLEMLVPKKLTNEERTDLLDLVLREIDTARRETLLRIGSSDDQNFKEKIVFGIGELDAMLTDVEQLIISEQLNVAETQALEAKDLADDLAFLTSDLPVSEIPVVVELIVPVTDTEGSDENATNEGGGDLEGVEEIQATTTEEVLVETAGEIIE